MQHNTTAVIVYRTLADRFRPTDSPHHIGYVTMTAVAAGASVYEKYGGLSTRLRTTDVVWCLIFLHTLSLSGWKIVSSLWLASVA